MPDERPWPNQRFVKGDLGRLTPQRFNKSDLFNHSEEHLDVCNFLLDNVFNVRDGAGEVGNTNYLYSDKRKKIKSDFLLCSPVKLSKYKIYTLLGLK